MQKYYTILTDVGVEKVRNAILNNVKIEVSQIAVGDGAGDYYEPVQTMNALKNEVWRGPVHELKTQGHEKIIVNSIIPSDVGGFFVREIGLFDSENELIAIGSLPETRKTSIGEGALQDIHLSMEISISNSDVFEITTDPTILLASKKDLEDVKEVVAESIEAINLQVSSLSTEVDKNKNAIAAINNVRAIKGTITIPKDGWEASGNEDYPLMIDIDIPNLTSEHSLDIKVGIEDGITWLNCNPFETIESMDGIVRIFAESELERDVTASYKVVI